MSSATPGIDEQATRLNPDDRLHSAPGHTGAPEPQAPRANTDFMSTLRNAMDQVGELQSEADGKVAQLLTGNGQDVHSDDDRGAKSQSGVRNDGASAQQNRASVSASFRHSILVNSVARSAHFARRRVRTGRQSPWIKSSNSHGVPEGTELAATVVLGG